MPLRLMSVPPTGLGFVITINSNQIVYIGTTAVIVDSSFVDEFLTAKLALEHCCWKSLTSEFLYTDCHSIYVILQEDAQVSWRYADILVA